MANNKDTENLERKNRNSKKDIKIVTGDGKDLNISPVYDHIKIDKPDNKPDKKQEIVIPKSKGKK